MKQRIKSFILFALLSMSPFLNAQNVECFVIAPPVLLPGVHKIAIMNFENFNRDEYYHTYGGAAFPDYLSAAFFDDTRGIHDVSSGLFSTKRGVSYIKCDGINKYQIIEREQINKVLIEKNLGSDMSLSDNQTAEIGKVLGIDALLTGTIRYNYTSRRNSVTSQSGNVTYYTENKCETEITVKVVSVATAQIMATKTFSNVYSDRKGGPDEGKVMRFEQLAPMNLKTIAFQVSSYFAPYYYCYKAEFGKIKVAEFKDKVNNIKSYLEAGDLKSAYSIYKAIYDADNYNAVAAANLGELYFITGDYEEAARWYDVAAQIDSKAYSKGNEAAKTWAGYVRTLRDYGVTIEKYDFTANANALADKIHTKGNKNDRFEVFERTDKSSAIQAKVPGDTEFIVIEKNGDFVKIKLLGGKEGYISRENLKKS